MNAHLGEISFHVSKDAHAIVIIDGAGWHSPGDRLIVPDNIALLRLPPYSPELNARENVPEDAGPKMAVSAPELSGRTKLRYLRRHCRCLLRGMESAHRR